MKKYKDLTFEEKKEIWWNHLLENKKFWHWGWTKRRLEKRKEDIFQDIDIWNDLFSRHSGYIYSPIEMKQYNIHVYLHGFGNFAGNVGSVLRVGMR